MAKYFHTASVLLIRQEMCLMKKDLIFDKISGTFKPPDKNGKYNVFLAMGSKSFPQINLKQAF